MPRYGIVGAGYFGAGLARILATLPDAEVTRIYSPHHASALAAELNCATAASVQALAAAPDVDAVVVASPNHAHLEPVLAAAAHGKHIFCEKPVALNYPDADAMVTAAGAAGVHFFAGHVMHFMDGVRRTRELVADGVLGELVLARAVRTGWEDEITGPSWKKQRDRSGGHLYHHIHELDLIQLILGPAQRVVMSGGNVAHAAVGFDEDDVLLATLEYDGRRFAHLEWGSAFRWPEHYVDIMGTEGAIRIELQQVGVTLRTAAGTTSFPLHRSEEEDADRRREYAASASGGGVTYGGPATQPPRWLLGIMERELGYFNELLQGAPVAAEFAALSDGSAARAAIATADALRVSLAQDRKVSVAEITG